jgi:hypothetical protein
MSTWIDEGGNEYTSEEYMSEEGGGWDWDIHGPLAPIPKGNVIKAKGPLKCQTHRLPLHSCTLHSCIYIPSLFM